MHGTSRQHRYAKTAPSPVLAGKGSYTRAIGLLDEIKRLLTGAKEDAETHAEGGEPVATPPGKEERETSTNAQMMGSSDEPWSGND